MNIQVDLLLIYVVVGKICNFEVFEIFELFEVRNGVGTRRAVFVALLKFFAPLGIIKVNFASALAYRKKSYRSSDRKNDFNVFFTRSARQDTARRVPTCDENTQCECVLKMTVYSLAVCLKVAIG